MPDGTTLLDAAPADAVESVVALLTTERQLTPQSVDKFAGVMWQFAGFVERGCGIRSLVQVDVTTVARFCRATTRGGRAASPAVMHFRRSSVRLLYRSARRLGHMVGDPTVDVSLPPRCTTPFRPLQDDEVELARIIALWSPEDTRLTTAWALCEATGRTSELPWIRAGDVDLSAGSVWLHGSSKVTARRALLTDWGRRQLGRRLAIASDDDELLLGVGSERGARAQSSAVMLISTTLRRAGLHEEPDLRPTSVPAWAGRRVFEETGQIEQAALALGMRSLDRTARFIGWSWTEPE